MSKLKKTGHTIQSTAWSEMIRKAWAHVKKEKIHASYSDVLKHGKTYYDHDSKTYHLTDLLKKLEEVSQDN
jgi:hypothetical protein